MGDGRDSDEETMDESPTGPMRRAKRSASSPDEAPSSPATTREDLRKIDSNDSAPEYAEFTSHSTISESAVTQAAPLGQGPTQRHPLLDPNPVDVSSSGPGAHERDPRGRQLTQESAPPAAVLGSGPAQCDEPASEDEPPPTRKLSFPDVSQGPAEQLDQLPKGSSIPPSVLRRVMEGLGSVDPGSTVPTHPRSALAAEDVSATEPMDQRAFAAALAEELGGQGGEVAPAEPQSPADGIISLADLVDDETTAASGTGSDIDLEDVLSEDSPTTQTRRPRPRVRPNLDATETPKRGARPMSKPTRPAVVRPPHGSRPARPVPPPVVDLDTSPPQAAEPQSTVQVERAKASKLPRLQRDERSPGRDAAGDRRGGPLREIPDPYGEANERSTVVKPNPRKPLKRTPASRKSVLASTSAAPVPKAIPIQALQNRVTAETYAAGDESEAASRRELSTFDVPPPEVEDGSGSSGVYRSVLAAVLDEAGPVGMLRIVTGDAEGQIFPLERAATTAGRGTDNDIVLLDLGVSRRHVVIHRHPEGFRLEDAQSGNGSFVNGAVVMESELFDGDFIRLGGTEMEFRTQGAPRLCQSVLAQSRAIQPHRVALLGLVTFCAAFATMLFVEWAGHTSAEGLAQAGITEWTKTAEAAADARRWRDAREALTVSRGFGPRSDHDALAVRIGRETDNARRFADLEREIEAKADIGTLDRLLASIDQGSVYRSEANLRARDAKKASIERTIDDAESDLAKGRSETARFKLEGVLQHEASHPRARKLLEELR